MKDSLYQSLWGMAAVGLFFVALCGHFLDIAVTLVAIDFYGCREGNPLMRPLLKTPSVGIALKVGVCTEMYRNAIRFRDLSFLWIGVIFGWGAVIWNCVMIGRKFYAERK